MKGFVLFVLMVFTCLASQAAAEKAAPTPAQPQTSAPIAAEAVSAERLTVSFRARRPTERWTLRDRDDQLLCELPCTREVQAHSGLQLRLEGDPPVEALRRPVPDSFDVAPGRAVVLEPKGLTPFALRPPWLAASATSTVASAGVLFTGFVMLATTSQWGLIAPMPAAEKAGWIGLASGVSLVGIAGIAASTYWSYRIIREWSAPDVELSRAEVALKAEPRAVFGPGGLALRF